MRLRNTTGKTPLKAANASTLAKSSTLELSKSMYFNLLVLIAEVVDTAIKEGDCYLIIGTTKDRSACSLTVVQGSDRGAVYGADLGELATGAGSLL